MSHIQTLAEIAKSALLPEPACSRYLRHGVLKAALEGVIRHDPDIETPEDLRAVTSQMVKEAFDQAAPLKRGTHARDTSKQFTDAFFRLVDETYHADLNAVASDRKRIADIFAGYLD